MCENLVYKLFEVSVNCKVSSNKKILLTGIVHGFHNQIYIPEIQISGIWLESKSMNYFTILFIENQCVQHAVCIETTLDMYIPEF